VERIPNLVGDFVWTGWDYLGESGIGVVSYGKNPTAAINKPFPHLLAGCGIIDIAGRPDPRLHIARAAWGRLDGPEIGVRPLNRSGDKYLCTPWRTTDARSSWAWKGADGRPAEVEVYSRDESVELFLNGRSVGRKRAGRRVSYVTRFVVPYEPGTLEAVSYRDGKEAGRSQLRSAAEVTLTLEPECSRISLSSRDLAYLHVLLADTVGTTEMLDDDEVTIEVSGPGTLAGFGSSDPSPARGFSDRTQSTYFGRALAIIRPTGEPGTIKVTARSIRHGVAAVDLTARPEFDTTLVDQSGNPAGTR
jgi:hypothetical protein